MSDTPKLADECKRLLDNGWLIQLYKNHLGSYTAVALSATAARKMQACLDELELEEDEDEVFAIMRGRFETDDFEPSQALYRLTEKVFGNIV